MGNWWEDMGRELNLSESEARLIEKANTGVTSDISSARTLEALYTVKKQEAMVNRLIESNTTLQASNNEHANAIKWLTAALVIVGVVDVLVRVFLNK